MLAVLTLATLAAAAADASSSALFTDLSTRTHETSLTRTGGALRVEVLDKGDGAPALYLSPRTGDWNLAAFRTLEVDVRNPGATPVTALLFAFSPGFGGISTFPQHPNGREVIEAGSSRTLQIDLHQRYPDGTESIDPTHIAHLKLVFATATPGATLEITGLRATGLGPDEPHDFPNRLRVPPVAEGLPAPGKRVFMSLPSGPAPRYVLYLPPDWTPRKRFPVIVEYSGNIFYWKNTYSTGLADQGNLGYGMSEGKGMIWVNLPFVEPGGKQEALNGWGDPDATVQYALAAIRVVTREYGGDPGAVIFTGFSRGGIACGFIGLRNDEIADVWLAFLAVQGGDGQNWHGSEMEGALERALRMKGRSSFIIDHAPWKQVLDTIGAPVTAVSSNIGAHVDTMLLDGRPSSVECRQWLESVLRNRPGVHDVSGTVRDRKGHAVSGVLIESGPTHFAVSDAQGKYVLRSLIDGAREIRASKAKRLFEKRSVTVRGGNLESVDLSELPRP